MVYSQPCLHSLGWLCLLTCFHSTRGYQMTDAQGEVIQDPFRQGLGYAVQWYDILQVEVERQVEMVYSMVDPQMKEVTSTLQWTVISITVIDMLLETVQISMTQPIFCPKALLTQLGAISTLNKAAMDSFDDTGIMALICRHDIPLFFANIDSPGEQQKYSVALLHHFFSFLLPEATVIALYDIGCVLARTLSKVLSALLVKNLQKSPAAKWQEGGFHHHIRPPRQLHLTKMESSHFQQKIEEHPCMGATKLVMGHLGINGLQESVATISPVLLNTARVNHERKKVFTKSQGKDIIAGFTEFQRQHLDFVIYHTFKPVAVVITQLPIMLSFLVKNHSNGIISDAAHGFWAERNDLLIISSVFSDTLQCWVPGVMTWSNGGTEAHYRHHFRALFETMTQEYERQNVILTDDLFANVTRIKKISGVVPPALTEVFADHVLQLLQCQDLATFKSISASLICDYPKAEGWLNWWMADGRAEMLFTPFRRMPDNLWYNLEDTTNAEEAMHWRIYCGLGKFHGFVAGLHALRAFSEYWQLQSASNSSGIPLFYGNSFSRDFETSFSPRMSELTDEDSLSLLSHAFKARTVLQGPDPSAPDDIASILFVQRETVRQDLCDKKIISAMDSFEAIFTWLGSLLNYPRNSAMKFMHGYFQLHMIDVRSCSGSPSNESSFMQDPHWQTVRKPRAVFHLQLQRSAVEKVDGDVKKPPTKTPSCWCVLDGETIRPLDGKAEECQGVVYDIIGRAFFSPASHHFIACYITPDKHIYNYNGMKLGGYATVDRKAKINTHVADGIGTAVIYQYLTNFNCAMTLSQFSQTSSDSGPRMQQSQPNMWTMCGSWEHRDLQEESEVAIQCNNCERWSHVACQMDGRASNLAKKEPFYCDTPDCAPYGDRWTHAHEVPQHEDVIANFRHIPYSVNIDEALAPHSQLLTNILEQPDPVKMRNAVPVLGYLADLSEKMGRKQTTVPYCGDLSLTDCAQIANWVYHRIPGASKQIVNWLNCATYAHACTIVIAKWKKDQLQEMAKHILTECHSAALDMDSKSVPTPKDEANVILQAAWLDLQLSYDPSAMDVDVDLECLGILEQRMFELSLAAGAAGNEQWGKDAGTHQDCWNPYEGLPEHWNHGDRDPYAPEFEGELDVHRFHIRSGRLH
ncbi:hypothetical protein BDR06DRAFT_977264 [Suillus hirtellus]|nr:hypothetical protein BDR06DRAFT_977264 [Suillus hirtellus]